MNRNYNFPSPDRQFRLGEGNQLGYWDAFNSQPNVNQGHPFDGNNFRNSFQQQFESGNIQPLFHQWLNQAPRQHLMMAGTNAPNNNSSTSNNRDSAIFENMHLKMELLKQYESLEFRAKLELRQKLPVMRQKNAILRAVQEHQVIMIVGDKGGGKSSQVPQMILDDYILDCRGNECRIICAEFTKISAMTLSERVACERNEAMGMSVGFHVRRER